MYELLNTLYVTTPGATVRIEHDALRVEIERELRLRLPLIALSALVVFERVSVTSYVLERFADDGKSVVWLDSRGRFRARLHGRVRGSVLLRRAQHLALSDAERTCGIARQIVAAKIQNSRQVLMRGARESTDDAGRIVLVGASKRLALALARLRETSTLDEVRGAEGEAARTYFDAFRALVRKDREGLTPRGRTRRPPRDPMNAALSFLYSLLRAECEAALEGVGLDPQVGFLHALRPGRPSLALDLLEELRPVIADRLALSLVNRGQLRRTDFEAGLGGAVTLSDAGRRTLIQAYQKRKDDELTHPVLGKRIPLKIVPHVQARLLARHLRGDLDRYPPFQWR